MGVGDVPWRGSWEPEAPQDSRDSAAEVASQAPFRYFCWMRRFQLHWVSFPRKNETESVLLHKRSRSRYLGKRCDEGVKSESIS